MERNKSTTDTFKSVSSDDLVLHMINQIKLYAVQHGKGSLNILEGEIRILIAVLLLPGDDDQLEDGDGRPKQKMT